MASLKKLFFVILIGGGGVLLTLPGFNLITLSQKLILYTGVAYIAVALLYYKL